MFRNRAYRALSTALFASMLSVAGTARTHAQCQYEVVFWVPDGPLCAPDFPSTFYAATMDEQGNLGGSVYCSSISVAGIWNHVRPFHREDLTAAGAGQQE